MSLNLISEVWSELRPYINAVDRGDAADTMVLLLINQDQDPEDIRQAFKSDADVRQALAGYLDQDGDEDDDDDDDDYLADMEDPDY